MVNNGSLSYDHDRDGTHTQLAGCEARFRNVEHETYVAIRYENDQLSGINTDFPVQKSWVSTFDVFQYPRILKIKRVGSHVSL